MAILKSSADLSSPEALSDAANALNTQMGQDLVACFEALALDPGELRSVVLTGVIYIRYHKGVHKSLYKR